MINETFKLSIVDVGKKCSSTLLIRDSEEDEHTLPTADFVGVRLSSIQVVVYASFTDPASLSC